MANTYFVINYDVNDVVSDWMAECQKFATANNVLKASTKMGSVLNKMAYKFVDLLSLRDDGGAIYIKETSTIDPGKALIAQHLITAKKVAEILEELGTPYDTQEVSGKWMPGKMYCDKLIMQILIHLGTGAKALEVRPTTLARRRGTTVVSGISALDQLLSKTKINDVAVVADVAKTTRGGLVKIGEAKTLPVPPPDQMETETEAEADGDSGSEYDA